MWADGKHVGTAADFDGSPSYLWLAAGQHELTIYRGGCATVSDEVEIQPGIVGKLKLRLEPGDASPPPGATG